MHRLQLSQGPAEIRQSIFQAAQNPLAQLCTRAIAFQYRAAASKYCDELLLARVYPFSLRDKQLGNVHSRFRYHLLSTPRSLSEQYKTRIALSQLQ